jgi:hypothetical protein
MIFLTPVSAIAMDYANEVAIPAGRVGTPLAASVARHEGRQAKRNPIKRVSAPRVQPRHRHLPSSVTPPSHGPEASPVASQSRKQEWIGIFRHISPVETKKILALNEEVSRITQGRVRLARLGDLKTKKLQNCLTCVVASSHDLSLLEVQFPSLEVVGKRSTERPQPVPRAKTNASKRSGSGNTIQNTFTQGFDVVNPDPWTYYIPDMGYQELGGYLPNGQLIDPYATITETWYRVAFEHTFPSDLRIRVGYDDTQVGGTTDDSLIVWNRQSSPFNYNIIENTTNYFNGLHPYSYYYAGAEDLAPLDIGHLDYVQFEITWYEPPTLPDLAIYTGTGSVNGYFVQNNQIKIQGSVSNLSPYDVTTPFGFGFYLSPLPVGGCQNMDFNAGNAYFVGAEDQITLPTNTYLNSETAWVPLNWIRNFSNQYMTVGWYCAWMYADDYDQVAESDEVNNVSYFETPFYYAGPVSTKAPITQAEIRIFPNPAQDVIRVSGVNSISRLEVLSLEGKTIKSAQGVSELDVGTLSPGTYLVRGVTSQGQTFTKTLIKE